MDIYFIRIRKMFKWAIATEAVARETARIIEYTAAYEANDARLPTVRSAA